MNTMNMYETHKKKKPQVFFNRFLFSFSLLGDNAASRRLCLVGVLKFDATEPFTLPSLKTGDCFIFFGLFPLMSGVSGDRFRARF